jgi:cytochrome c-type biogenesis protein CcsB
MIKYLLLFLISATLQAEVCVSDFSTMAIQQGGRVKPLYVHARETIKHLTGKSNHNGEDPVTTYCKLSLAPRYGIAKVEGILLPAEHVDLKKFLELDLGKSKILADDVVSMKSELRIEIMKQKEESSYKKSLTRLFSRAHLYEELTAGKNWLVPMTIDQSINWVPIATAPFEDGDQLISGLARTQAAYNKLKPDSKHNFELAYAKLKLPHVSMIITLLALAALTLFKRFNLALGLSLLTMAIETVLIVSRIYLSGRAPITNMYETVLFSGYGALFIAIILGHFKKDKTFIFVGLAYNVLCLFMMNFSTGMLSDSISPLVPVLRDNFWLSTHVTMIILSYGALALSWVLANTVLLKKKLGKLDAQDERYYADLIYSCLKIGTVLLAGGVLLGGVWADYSWGRFWGWDPKETWSLIVLCLYMAILHGRYTAWIPNKRFISLTALAFMSVMMAWFGVNYILATGLHSYGFSEGGAIFLGSFFAIQITFSLLTWTSFDLSTKKVEA